MLSALNAFSSALSMFSALNAFNIGIKKTSIGGPVTSSSSGNSNTLPSTLRPICKIGDSP